jgi:hypothetical protein
MPVSRAFLTAFVFGLLSCSTSDGGNMDINKFWRIVDEAKVRAGNDIETRIETLRKGLSGFAPAELQKFQNIYDQQIQRSYRWDLWGAAYVMNSGCSDDGFRYFRDWLISEGREIFERALTDPDSLAELPRVDVAELELYGYVALELFEEKAEGELERDFSTEGAEPAGKQWSEEQLPSLFPRLHAMYGSK